MGPSAACGLDSALAVDALPRAPRFYLSSRQRAWVIKTLISEALATSTPRSWLCPLAPLAALLLRSKPRGRVLPRRQTRGHLLLQQGAPPSPARAAGSPRPPSRTLPAFLLGVEGTRGRSWLSPRGITKDTRDFFLFLPFIVVFDHPNSVSISEASQ